MLFTHYASSKTAVGSLSWNTGSQTTVYMIKPLSRGSIAINSTSIVDNLLIDCGALTDPTDIELVLSLFLKNRQIMAQPSMQALGPTEISPGASITSDEDLKVKFRALINTSNTHECCTLPMMKLELGGVVDDQLRLWSERVERCGCKLHAHHACKRTMGYNLCCWGKGALFQKLVILN